MECYLDDDELSPQVIAVEATDTQGHRQSLWIHVGPVFYGDSQSEEPGIWIEYQEEHMKSPLAGPVLLTPKVWHQLVKSINRDIKRKRRKRWTLRTF